MSDVERSRFRAVVTVDRQGVQFGNTWVSFDRLAGCPDFGDNFEARAKWWEDSIIGRGIVKWANEAAESDPVESAAARVAEVEQERDEAWADIAVYRVYHARMIAAEAEAGRLREAAEREERAMTQVIEERDNAEESLSQAYYIVTGNSPQWSNLFGHKQALDDIADAVNLLKETAKEAALSSTAEKREASVVKESLMTGPKPVRMSIVCSQCGQESPLTKQPDPAAEIRELTEAVRVLGEHVRCVEPETCGKTWVDALKSAPKCAACAALEAAAQAAKENI